MKEYTVLTNNETLYVQSIFWTGSACMSMPECGHWELHLAKIMAEQVLKHFMHSLGMRISSTQDAPVHGDKE